MIGSFKHMSVLECFLVIKAEYVGYSKKYYCLLYLNLIDVNILKHMKDLFFTEDHEWLKKSDDGLCTIGISDHAQKQLGDIVFVELPETNKTVKQGEVFGSVESVKSVSELYTPISGEIVQINSELESNPELINSDAYKAGWIIKVKPSDISELDELMSKSEYEDFIQD